MYSRVDNFHSFSFRNIKNFIFNRYTNNCKFYKLHLQPKITSVKLTFVYCTTLYIAYSNSFFNDGGLIYPDGVLIIVISYSSIIQPLVDGQKIQRVKFHTMWRFHQSFCSYMKSFSFSFLFTLTFPFVFVSRLIILISIKCELHMVNVTAIVTIYILGFFLSVHSSFNFVLFNDEVSKWFFFVRTALRIKNVNLIGGN